MMPHIRTGKNGEELGADWLKANGYHILHRNWRRGRYEVDIIAAKGNTIHFIEIKTRRTNAYGPPEQSVNRKKIEHMLQGASSWLISHPGHTHIQYDVLAIALTRNNPPEYTLFKDVSL
jgi:putative endonuclease